MPEPSRFCAIEVEANFAEPGSSPEQLSSIGGLSIAGADLDGDGYPDLATANDVSKSVSILGNKGSTPPP